MLKLALFHEGTNSVVLHLIKPVKQNDTIP